MWLWPWDGAGAGELAEQEGICVFLHIWVYAFGSGQFLQLPLLVTFVPKHPL